MIISTTTSEHYALYLWPNDKDDPVRIGSFETKEEANETGKIFTTVEWAVYRVKVVTTMEAFG